jgi:hypothetical protein
MKLFFLKRRYMLIYLHKSINKHWYNAQVYLSTYIPTYSLDYIPADKVYKIIRY